MAHELTDITTPNLNGPRLDEAAPNFAARTTQGVKQLSDYKGKWLVLFSHPADFTPVCTSEFIAFQNTYADFKAIGCELLGLSVDSVYSHLAWLDSIDTGFNTRIEFPIIEDVSMAVSYAYGMIHDNSVSTATVRSVFFIDPDGILRAMSHYPMSVGRNVDEILRIIKALQVTDKSDISVPEGWQPGDKGVANPPTFHKDAPAVNDSPTWYYKEVDIPAEVTS